MARPKPIRFIDTLRERRVYGEVTWGDLEFATAAIHRTLQVSEHLPEESRKRGRQAKARLEELIALLREHIEAEDQASRPIAQRRDRYAQISE